MIRRIEEFTYRVLGDKKRQTFILLATLALFIVTILLIPTKIVLAKMLPGKDSNTFSVYIDMPQNASVFKTREIVSCVVGELKKNPDVTDIESFIGESSPVDIGGLVKGQPMKQGRNIAEIVVNLLKKHDGRSEYSFVLVHDLRPKIKELCEKDGANIKFVEPPAGPPVLASVVAEIYGDEEIIDRVSSKVADIFGKTTGLVDIDIISDRDFERFILVPDNEKIIKSGIDIEQMNKILYMAFEGVGVAVKNSDSEFGQIPLFVRLKDSDRAITSSTKEVIVAKLSQLKMMNNLGASIPLSSLVTVQSAPNSKTIYSKNLRRYVNVVAETDMVSQIYPLLDARETIKEEMSDNYIVENSDMLNLKLTDKNTQKVAYIVWDGELEVSLDTFKDLGGAFIAALALIFFLMSVYYKSFTLSGIVLLGSFLSIIGVIWGHLFMDIVTAHTFFLTATSLIGYIALIGISSRNSLLLIDFAKALISKGMEKKRAIAVAVATRARPIFLTALAIILASSILASDAVFGGLGVALIFGTIAAVVASLVVVPILMERADLGS